MFFKDPLSLLAECAALDLRQDTEMAVNESKIMSTYRSIEEAAEPVFYGPEMVPVVKVGNDYLTEMQFLAPYIQGNNIASVAEALDYVAEANELPAKSVGLLVESECDIECMIKEAIGKSKATGNKMLGKVKKGEGLIDKLMKKGYKVKKKKNAVKESAEKKCTKCGKIPCECGTRSGKNEEGTNSGSTPPGEGISDTSNVNTVVDDTSENKDAQ